MDRGAWQATIPGIAESDMTKQVTLSLSLSVEQGGKKGISLHDIYHSVKSLVCWSQDSGL